MKRKLLLFLVSALMASASASPATEQDAQSLTRTDGLLDLSNDRVQESTLRALIKIPTLLESEDFIAQLPAKALERAAARTFQDLDRPIVIAQVAPQKAKQPAVRSDEETPSEEFVDVDEDTIYVGLNVLSWNVTSSRDIAVNQQHSWRDVDMTIQLVIAGPAEATSAMRKLAAILQAAMQDEMLSAARPTIDKLKQSSEQAIKQSQAHQQRFTELSAKRTELASQLTASKTLIEERVAALEQQHQAAELESVGYRARTAALKQQLENARSGTPATTVEEELFRDLQAVIDIREEEMQQVNVLHQVEKISSLEVLQAREKLLQAKIELARAKAGRGTDNSLIEKLNSLLVEATVDMTAAQARLEYLQKELAARREALATERERDDQLAVIEKETEEARRQWYNLSEQGNRDAQAITELVDGIRVIFTGRTSPVAR